MFYLGFQELFLVKLAFNGNDKENNNRQRQGNGEHYLPRQNPKENGLLNTTFIAGDIKDTLTNAFVAEHGQPDVIITDPPRAGMHPAVVTKIVELFPERIVYVSCNPGTQARDLAMMDEKYVVKSIQPVDMFPHTTHVENVVLLNRRS